MERNVSPPCTADAQAHLYALGDRRKGEGRGEGGTGSSPTGYMRTICKINHDMKQQLHFTLSPPKSIPQMTSRGHTPPKPRLLSATLTPNPRSCTPNSDSDPDPGGLEARMHHRGALDGRRRRLSQRGEGVSAEEDSRQGTGRTPSAMDRQFYERPEGHHERRWPGQRPHGRNGRPPPGLANFASAPRHIHRGHPPGRGGPDGGSRGISFVNGVTWLASGGHGPERHSREAGTLRSH